MDKNKIHITTDNVAVPEVHFEEKPDENDEKEKKGPIDYDVAVPELHIKKD